MPLWLGILLRICMSEMFDIDLSICFLSSHCDDLTFFRFDQIVIISTGFPNREIRTKYSLNSIWDRYDSILTDQLFFLKKKSSISYASPYYLNNLSKFEQHIDRKVRNVNENIGSAQVSVVA